MPNYQQYVTPPTPIGDSYDAFYQARNPEHVYPVEFVVQAISRQLSPAQDGQAQLSRQARARPRIPATVATCRCCTISACGYRGWRYLRDLRSRRKAEMQALGVEADLRVGRNHAIPYSDGFFDTVLACHACYYIDPGTRFDDNLREIARVLRPAGAFIFSAPIGTSYIMAGAKDIGDGHMEIANDPYGVRNGYVLRKFDSEAEDPIRAVAGVYRFPDWLVPQRFLGYR